MVFFKPLWTLKYCFHSPFASSLEGSLTICTNHKWRSENEVIKEAVESRFFHVTVRLVTLGTDIRRSFDLDVMLTAAQITPNMAREEPQSRGGRRIQPGNMCNPKVKWSIFKKHISARKQRQVGEFYSQISQRSNFNPSVAAAASLIPR